MITVITIDSKPVTIATTSNVGGPPTKGSKGGGQAFGMYYTYISWDDKETWWKVPFRSEHQASGWVSTVTLQAVIDRAKRWK